MNGCSGFSSDASTLDLVESFRDPIFSFVKVEQISLNTHACPIGHLSFSSVSAHLKGKRVSKSRNIIVIPSFCCQPQITCVAKNVTFLTWVVVFSALFHCFSHINTFCRLASFVEFFGEKVRKVTSCFLLLLWVIQVKGEGSDVGHMCIYLSSIVLGSRRYHLLSKTIRPCGCCWRLVGRWRLDLRFGGKVGLEIDTGKRTV